MKLVALFLAASLAYAASLQAQQSNAESTDIQRQLEHVRAYASQLNRAPILPQEAKAHVGEFTSVRGLMVQTAFHRGNAFLNFGDRYPRQAFTGFVRAPDIERVGGRTFLRSLVGNPVTIVGEIELFKGRPEIVITSSNQIQK